MSKKNKQGHLTSFEEKIVKALLAKNWRNQDIQHLINIGRDSTINSGRITEVKQSENIISAEDSEVENYLTVKNNYDSITGLNIHMDERLIRSREAMILAVSLFNNPSVKFKSEVFLVLNQIAWTYALHEFLERKKVSIQDSNFMTFPLSVMIKMDEINLNSNVQKNLEYLIQMRDLVEHKIFKRTDKFLESVFQASCINFENFLVNNFGRKTSLSSELAFALQFSTLTKGQAAQTFTFNVPSEIVSYDKKFRENLNLEGEGCDFELKIKYQLTSASKTESDIVVNFSNVSQADTSNIVVQKVASDELYPYKPAIVVKMVIEKSGQKFTSSDHVRAFKYYKARPNSNSKTPEKTRKEFCNYNKAHRDYTYCDKWVELLINAFNNGDIEKIREKNIL